MDATCLPKRADRSKMRITSSIPNGKCRAVPIGRDRRYDGAGKSNPPVKSARNMRRERNTRPRPWRYANGCDLSAQTCGPVADANLHFNSEWECRAVPIGQTRKSDIESAGEFREEYAHVVQYASATLEVRLWMRPACPNVRTGRRCEPSLQFRMGVPGRAYRPNEEIRY